MRREIELLGNRYELGINGPSGRSMIKIEDRPSESSSITNEGGSSFILVRGEDICPMELAGAGEEVFIQAFGRNFSLRILDPVEQAAQGAGAKGNTARAPMPGVVVETAVRQGDFVKRGSPLMTIESMKILTVIKAPREGRVEKVHVEKGQAFEKNAVLVTLGEESERPL
jgi:biotin carboxyl carrier protein